MEQDILNRKEPDMFYRKGNAGRSTLAKRPNETWRILVTACVGIMFGFFIGVAFPSLQLTKLNVTSALLHDFVIIGNNSTGNSTEKSANSNNKNQIVKDTTKIWVPSNPKGAERLPPGIVASESDFYLRRLWGLPKEDLTTKPKYLVTFTVGYDQRNNIDAAVKKFSENFTILLFHYDGRTTEWDEFEWSKRAIHVSAIKQTKWWYAKRFLHPDIVAPYDYIFIWDEDLGVEHFDAEEYIKLVRKYGLEISQPGLEPTRTTTWQMTKRRNDREVHKETEEKPGWCSDPHLPPCAAFVEIMAPVFSRDAWRCVWHMIQNDLVHGWGLDLALQRCVELDPLKQHHILTETMQVDLGLPVKAVMLIQTLPAHEKIGVVDAQWIVHQTIPSLGSQGQEENGKAPWQGVRLRCRREWTMFRTRMENAEKSYYKSIGIDPSNFTGHT